MKYTNEEKKENRNAYFREANKNCLKIRVTPEEKTLLLQQMKAEGWMNITGYIKYKLFGLDPEDKLDKIIETKDAEAVGRLLFNQMLDYTNYYRYVCYRYDKDMTQLYREEGVDLDQWRKATNRWHMTLIKKTEDMLGGIVRISQSIGLNEFFELPSDKMEIDLENATKEEMDALAAQIQKEQTALGRPDLM